jgi:chromosome segregation ATPase
MANTDLTAAFAAIKTALDQIQKIKTALDQLQEQINNAEQALKAINPELGKAPSRRASSRLRRSRNRSAMAI